MNGKTQYYDASKYTCLSNQVTDTDTDGAKSAQVA